MNHDQLVLTLQAEVVAYSTHRSTERMKALQTAAAACRAAGIGVGPILTSTITEIHSPDEITRCLTEAIAKLPPPRANQRLTSRVRRWTRDHHRYLR
ncbi:hypothetical protein [Nocardia carnea]|uniref:hypothetical protein n=1 Tax=Nocardia carnea TaxID=37328 RepID=UPI002454DFF3|nr:hypothetical protein [Nocardia carnea]